jgi:hypothetical protein
MVYVENGRVAGEVTLPAAGGGTSEVVEIHETIPPAVSAVLRSDPTLIPEYSDTAIGRRQHRQRAVQGQQVDAVPRLLEAGPRNGHARAMAAAITTI